MRCVLIPRSSICVTKRGSYLQVRKFIYSSPLVVRNIGYEGKGGLDYPGIRFTAEKFSGVRNKQKIITQS
jgi:hypothetical protein